MSRPVIAPRIFCLFVNFPQLCALVSSVMIFPDCSGCGFWCNGNNFRMKGCMFFDPVLGAIEVGKINVGGTFTFIEAAGRVSFASMCILVSLFSEWYVSGRLCVGMLLMWRVFMFPSPTPSIIVADLG